jgi:hypothetical protein
MATSSDIILQNVLIPEAREGEAGQSENTAGNPEFSLPKADGGKDAWLFLAACFTVEALVWGESSLSKAGINLTLHRISILLRRLPRLLQYT